MINVVLLWVYINCGAGVEAAGNREGARDSWLAEPEAQAAAR